MTPSIVDLARAVMDAPDSWNTEGYGLARAVLADSLDAAWSEAEAALPDKGWWVISFEHTAEAPRYRASEQSNDPPIWGPIWADTPAAALRALAVKLREGRE